MSANEKRLINANLTDVEVLQREIECVRRKSATNCTDCLNCDLLMTDERILSAYDNAIKALQRPVDVMEVVPCKDCIHYEYLGYFDDPDDKWYECRLGILNKKRHKKDSDAFCSYGKRRSVDGKNCVFLPVQPRWCERIASGDKTDEIRKNSPKTPVPFKCYIYQSKGLWSYPILRSLGLNDLVEKLESGKGKVIGEFICDRIEQICVDNDKRLSKTSCVSLEEMWKYAAPKSAFDLKAWHISDLKIYDKPKQLSEFYLSRAPQSWCYVEEVA